VSEIPNIVGFASCSCIRVRVQVLHRNKHNTDVLRRRY